MAKTWRTFVKVMPGITDGYRAVAELDGEEFSLAVTFTTRKHAQLEADDFTRAMRRVLKKQAAKK